VALQPPPSKIDADQKSQIKQQINLPRMQKNDSLAKFTTSRIKTGAA
jgi:hypothetical protein